MTEFEIDATFNTICRPGRVVKILTKNGKRGECPYKGLEVLDDYQDI